MSKILKRFMEQILHSDLGDVQGGREGEHYHMTYEEWAKLPVKPYIVSPEDGATNVNQVPQIQGSPYVHPYNLPMHGRHIQIATDAEFENIVYELPEEERFSESTTFQIFLKDDETSYFEPGTTYYVRIRYQDRNMKWSGWSDVSRFTTMAEFPDNVLIAPQMIIPPDGGIVRAKDPILAMSAAQTAVGLGMFDRADWQIAHSPTFADDTILYQALETDALTLHQADGLSLSSALGLEFYARGRQWPVGETDGTKVPWTPYVSFGIRPDYDNPVFGLRKLFSKKYGVPFVWNIDEEGNIVSIPQKYWNEHPLYNALDKDNATNILIAKVQNGTEYRSSMIFVPPCWMKHRVYDNVDGDMVIDTWYSPTPQTGDGWRMDMAFAKNERGFYHGTCLCLNSGYIPTPYATYVPFSYYNGGATYNMDYIKNLSGIDSRWHMWTIYERRLLLDLMMAEYASVQASRVSLGSGVNNGDAAFKWRGFRGLMMNENNGYAIMFDGIKQTDTTSESIDKIQVMTPDRGNWMPYDTSLVIGDNMYATDILRGESEEMGFDVALLGIISATEANTGQTSSPFGAAPGMNIGIQRNNTFYGDINQNGLFAIGSYQSSTNSGYMRVSMDYS